MNEMDPHATPPSRGVRSNSQQPRLVQALEEQTRHWRSGERVHVETLLERHPALGPNREALLDLVYHEIMLREQLGETPSLDEYRRRFPDLADDLARQFHIDAALEAHVAASKTSRPGAARRPASGLLDSGQARPIVPGFDLFESLGRGGVGIVYKARQISLNRLVALKIMLAGAHASVH